MQYSIVDELGKTLAYTARTAAAALIHAVRLEALVEDLPGDGTYIGAYSAGLSISTYGNRKQLDLVWGLLREHGFEPAERPGTELFFEFTTEFKHESGARIFFRFTSTVCKREQVGTRTVEEPVYEIRCGEESGNADQTEV